MRDVRRLLLAGVVASLVATGVVAQRPSARAAGVGISYTVADASANEGSAAAPGVMAFTVTADGVFTSPETLRYSTRNGTAIAGVDYTATSGELTFSASGSQTVTVPLEGDAASEPDETFSLVLSDNASISDGTGVGTITNDDFSLSIGDATVAEGNGGSTNAAVQISLSRPRNAPTTVNYQSNNGTAVAGQDYTAVSGTATIPAEQQSTTVSVPISGDTLYEDDERFTVALSAPSSPVTIGDGSAVVTIDNDDPQPPPDQLPKLSIAGASTPESDDGTHAAPFTVTLDGSTAHTVTVTVSTANGTAVSPDDYVARTNVPLTFPPSAGPQSQPFHVTVKGDTADEPDETFAATLSSPSGATLDDAAKTATMTIVDDDASPTTTTTTQPPPIVPPPAPGQITAGAGPGSGSHVRVFDRNGAAQAPEGFFPFANGPGVRVARGDLDGDQRDELVVATGPGAPSVVRVFSPDGSSLLAEADAYPGFSGGVYVAVGDVDGDGKGELVTAAGAGGGPHVRTFDLVGSGSGRLLQGAPGFFGARADFTGGLTVASGDVDGDDRAEIVLGAAGNDQPVVYVWKYNPASNTATPHANPFLAYTPEFLGGVTVAAGDLDGDGRAEIATGPGPGGGPHVRVFTGTGGGLPGSAYAYEPGFTGGVFVSIGDIDEDGRGEIVTGVGPGGGPHIRAFDVNVAPKPTSFYAFAPTSTGGVFVAVGRS